MPLVETKSDEYRANCLKLPLQPPYISLQSASADCILISNLPILPLVKTKGDEYKQIASSHRYSHHPFHSDQLKLIATLLINNKRYGVNLCKKTYLTLVKL